VAENKLDSRLRGNDGFRSEPVRILLTKYYLDSPLSHSSNFNGSLGDQKSFLFSVETPHFFLRVADNSG
jgi:hypothetical protein